MGKRVAYHLVLCHWLKLRLKLRIALRYGTPQFLLRSTVRFFCNGTGAARWYGTF